MDEVMKRLVGYMDKPVATQESLEKWASALNVELVSWSLEGRELRVVIRPRAYPEFVQVDIGFSNDPTGGSDGQ